MVEDADAQRHEGLGEVDHLLPHVGDGQGGHSQVRHLAGTQVRRDDMEPRKEGMCECGDGNR